MNLGQDAWDRSKWYYDQLTLRDHGDLTEQVAADEFSLDTDLSNYVEFWRYHIAPSSERPFSIYMRQSASEIMSLISQRSYSVLLNLVEAAQQLDVIREEGLGKRHRSATIALSFMGNAMVMFAELERVVSGPPNQFTRSVGSLADKLRVDIKPLSKTQNQAWRSLREEIVVYRHYLTHQGVLFTVAQGDGDQPRVLRREHLMGMEPMSWHKVEQSHMETPDHWTSLGDACRQAVKDAVALLNMGYEALAAEMQPLLVNPDYQRLWGWYGGMSEIPNPPPGTPAGSSATRGSDSLSGINPSRDIVAAHQRSSASARHPQSGT